MKDLEEYRAAILRALMQASDADGTPKLTKAEAEALVAELSDNELSDGMPFNTPEEVAELLLDSGL
ncbi:hypothetical protein [Hallella colorans]|uniref:Uncharacterized protein n=1 Tax=Hallella colorans TaxID=1703337 RepID=A0A2U0U7C6_9BACT|nr:hypothetical protein [Hallella colorans]PVX53518.1 hypothetical protein C7379_11131 [Hallella colorans]